MPPLGVDGPRYPRISIEGPPGPKLCLGYVDTSRDSLGHVAARCHHSLLWQKTTAFRGDRVYLHSDAITVCCGQRPQYLKTVVSGLKKLRCRRSWRYPAVVEPVQDILGYQ